jgi:chemotaxis methyl-accepting protein methylase
MHRLMAGGTILEHELSDLRLLVERQAGILLDCPNSALAAHVADYLDSQDLDSAASVLERLRSGDLDPAFLPQFLDGVVNTDTGFFRHPGAMSALTRQVLPQLFARKSADNPATLRMWSAGCSTGEEPYSIAMAACAALSGINTANAPAPVNGNGNGNASGGGKNGGIRNGGISETSSCAAGQSCGLPGVQVPGSHASGTLPPGTLPAGREWSIHIVGSDLLPSAIEIAERGLYPQSALAGLPPATIRACFSKIGSANGTSNGNENVSLNGASDTRNSEARSNDVRGHEVRSHEVRNNEVRNNDGLLGDEASNGGKANGGSGSRKLSALSNGASATQKVLANGSHLLVKPRLRSLVTFNTMNLTKPVYIGRFDCIFCMDVLPHLSRVQRTALLERLHLYLEPGGYLFLSQTEKLSAPNLNFRSETFDGYTFHRKPLAASAAYGR